MQPEPPSIPPPSKKTALGLVFLIVVIDLLGFAIVLPLLPRYAERFGASGLVIGLLFSSYSAMQFLFAPIWGRVSDRVGRRPVLLLGLLGSVVFYALFGVGTIMESLTLIFVSRFGAGACGATISTAQAYIADATGPSERARGMAMIGAAFGIGFTLGPILGSIALPHAAAPGEIEPLNALPGFLAAGLSFIALLIAVVKLPESLRRDAASSPAAHEWFRADAIRHALRVPTVGLLLLLSFITVAAFTQWETTLSRLTEEAFHLSDQRNFLLFTYIGVVLTIAQGLLVRRLVPKLGEPLMLCIGAVLLTGGLAMVNISISAASFTWLLVVTPLTVCGFAFITPSAQSLISRRSDPSRQGEILGVAQSASAMARILAPVLGNVLFDLGARWPYVVAALMVVPTIAMAYRTRRSGADWESPRGFPVVLAEEPAHER